MCAFWKSSWYIQLVSLTSFLPEQAESVLHSHCPTSQTLIRCLSSSLGLSVAWAQLKDEDWGSQLFVTVTQSRPKAQEACIQNYQSCASEWLEIVN